MPCMRPHCRVYMSHEPIKDHLPSTYTDKLCNAGCHRKELQSFAVCQCGIETRYLYIYIGYIHVFSIGTKRIRENTFIDPSHSALIECRIFFPTLANTIRLCLSQRYKSMFPVIVKITLKTTQVQELLQCLRLLVLLIALMSQRTI